MAAVGPRQQHLDLLFGGGERLLHSGQVVGRALDALTESIIMRSAEGTIRRIETIHRHANQAGYQPS